MFKIKKKKKVNTKKRNSKIDKRKVKYTKKKKNKEKNKEKVMYPIDRYKNIIYLIISSLTQIDTICLQ